MCVLISRMVAALVALTLLAGGIAAQEKKKQRTKTSKTSAAKKSTKPATAKTPAQPYTGDPIPPPQPPEQGDGVRRITPAEAREAFEKGTAIIVDVRNETVYNSGHIKGAILIPGAEIGSRIKELPRDKMIITYCSWPAEHSSAGAVLTLKQNGFDDKKVAALLGGYQGWVNAGFPTESNQ